MSNSSRTILGAPPRVRFAIEGGTVVEGYVQEGTATVIPGTTRYELTVTISCDDHPAVRAFVDALHRRRR